MNSTWIKLTLGLTSLLLASGALAGCTAGPETDDSTEHAEEVGEAQGAEELATPVGPNFRLRFKHSQRCAEPVAETVGAPIVQRACTPGSVGNTDRQGWIKLSGPIAGQYQLMYAKSGQPGGTPLCLHLAGPSAENGAAYALYTCDAARTNQWFTADPLDAEGYGGIKSAYSARCMAVFGGLLNDDVLVYQYGAACTGDHQKMLRDTGGATPAPW